MDGERGEPCVEGERYLMRADGEKKKERTENLEKQEFCFLYLLLKKKQPKKTKKTTKNFKGHNLTKLN